MKRLDQDGTPSLFRTVRSVLRQRDQRFFFLVSSGRTATTWIARAMNLHPEVFCSHGPNFLPHKTDETEETFAERIYRQAPEFERLAARDIVGLFDRRSHSVYGNVHGVSMNLAKTLLDYEDVYIGQITRNPISRIDSFVSVWLREYGKYETRRDQIEKSVDDAKAQVEQALGLKVELPASLADRLVLSAASMLIPNDAYLLKVKEVETWRQEDITQDIDAFERLFRACVQDRVRPTRGFLQSVQGIGVQNSFKSQAEAPADVYRKWDRRQQDLVGRLIELHGMSPVYEGLGYDLSYMR